MFGLGNKEATITLSVEGMTCQGCVKGVERAITGVDGVTSVEVSLEKKQAQVKGKNFDVTKIIAAIEEKGFQGEKI